MELQAGIHKIDAIKSMVHVMTQWLHSMNESTTKDDMPFLLFASPLCFPFRFLTETFSPLKQTIGVSFLIHQSPFR